jgi:glycosyltransferase involved in cell wall biosynthesis
LSIEKPLVSVVIPVKNGMPYLKNCIESVFASTYSNIEIIVSHDNSSDGTSEYLLGVEHPKLRLISPIAPMTIGEHWTFVSSQAKGKYVKLLCADDTITPMAIQNQVEELEKDPQIAMVCSKRNVINMNGKILIPSYGLKRRMKYLEGKAALRKTILSGTNIFGEPSSVLFRGDVFKVCLPWVEERVYLLDLDFYAKVLLQNYSVAFLSTTDGTFRVHGGSLSSRVQKNHVNQFMSFAIENYPKLKTGKFPRRIVWFNAQIKTSIRSLFFSLNK